jgi:hypothetical protein
MRGIYLKGIRSKVLGITKTRPIAALTHAWKALRLGRDSSVSTSLGMPVRSLFTLLLVALLIACPAMCRATEVACCPGHEAGECSDESGQQAPAPTDADSCICSGAALKADDSHAKNVLPLLAALLPESFESSLRSHFEAISRRSLLADPDEWPRPVRLHALLEVFRC